MQKSISKATSGSLNAFISTAERNPAVWKAVEAAKAAVADTKCTGNGIDSRDPRTWYGRHVYYRIKK